MLNKELDAFGETWIREHLANTNWELACMGHNFSLDFMRQMRDKIDWEVIFCSRTNGDLPRKFIEELGFDYWEHPGGTLFVDIPIKNGVKTVAARIKLY